MLIDYTKWCNAIEIKIQSKRIVIFNVYLPYQCQENEDTYLNCLGDLHVMLEELDSTCYAVIGDWNADLRDSPSSLFAHYMLSFCNEHDLCISSINKLPSDGHTCVSSAWGSVSWLDHIVTSDLRLR